MKSRFDPKVLLYQSQKIKVRALRAVETVERLIGARPGQKLEVNFRAGSLENTVRRIGQRVVVALIAAANVFAAGMTVSVATVADWVPETFAAVAGLLFLWLIVDGWRQR